MNGSGNTRFQNGESTRRPVIADVELSRWCEVNPSVKLRTGIGDIGMSYWS